MTEARTVKTSEIEVGSVVREHGMRARIGSITVHPGQGNNGLDVYSCQGTVLNLDEVWAARIVPASFLTTEK